MTARVGSVCSNAPRGAVWRYTTETDRSLRSCSSGAPSEATVGRRSAAGATRRSSMRPRTVPGRAVPGPCADEGADDVLATTHTPTAAAARTTGAMGRLAPGFISLEPEHELGRDEREPGSSAAVAGIVLDGCLDLQVTQNREAAAGFDACNRCVPFRGLRRAGYRAEAEVVVANGGIQPRVDLVTTLQRRRERTERLLVIRPASDRERPVAENGLQADEVVPL